MWNLIKKDYGHVDSITNIDDNDDDDFLISAFSLISEVKPVNEDTSQPSASTEPLLSTEPSTSSLTYVSNTELKSLIVDLQEKVTAGKENVPTRTQEVLKKIGDSLRCIICMEICNCDNLFFCIHCGRMVGCFTCCVGLDKCPTCREEFVNCETCTRKVAFKVPGLDALLNQGQ